MPAQRDRRWFLRAAGLTGAAAVSGALGACGQATGGARGDRTIRIGYVSPQTGVLAGFGESDGFVLDRVRKRFADGIDAVGTTQPVEILVQDSQSDVERAAEVTQTLIDQGVDIVLVASTPETTNPVSAVCEAAEKPCISAVAPWQSWYLGRQDAKTAQDEGGYAWTYHFFWGLEDLIQVYLEMWNAVPTNKVVGGLWPDDGDGQAFQANFPDAIGAQGYRVVRVPNGGIFGGGRYEANASDFTAALEHFRDQGVEIITGVPTPPDFATIWKQAGDMGFRPKIVTAAKALLFPSFIEALTPSADGVSTELWWSPQHPFTSSLTGERAGQIAEDYVNATAKQWTQPIGFVHALFEVAVNVFGRVDNLDDPAAIRDAVAETQMDTVVGPVSWRKDAPTVVPDAPNVSKTPLVGGQWRTGSQFPFDLVVVTRNQGDRGIDVASDVQPLA